MIKRTAILMTTAFMFVTLPGAAFAGDQDQDRIRDQDPIMEQLQDGSCLDYSTDSVSFILAADRQRDRDKDKDKDKDKDCKVTS